MVGSGVLADLATVHVNVVRDERVIDWDLQRPEVGVPGCLIAESPAAVSISGLAEKIRQEWGPGSAIEITRDDRWNFLLRQIIRNFLELQVSRFHAIKVDWRQGVKNCKPNGLGSKRDIGYEAWVVGSVFG